MSRRGISKQPTSVDLGDDQMQEFKAAFSLFSDGKDRLDAATLKRVLNKFNIKNANADDMIKEADTSNEGSIDFVAFSQLMSRKMAKTDSEADLTDAFQKFDWKKSGTIPSNEISEALTNIGKPITQRELQEFLAVCEKEGQCHYPLFVKAMFGEKAMQK